MGDNRRNAPGERKRREVQSRKKLLWSYVIWLAVVVLLCVMVYYIKSVNDSLEEIWEALSRIEVSRGVEGIVIPDEEDIETDYVSSIPVMAVERPVERSYAEIVQRLEGLGQSNPQIAEIAGNASRYSDKLLEALANNPEMADFAAGYPDGGGDVQKGFTQNELEQEFPLFLQWDPRWGYEEYGNSNIGLSGCGPTCVSMVLFSLTRDESFTPESVAAYSMENGYYVEGTGTAWALMEDLPKQHGLRVTKPDVSEWAFKRELDEGRMLICAMDEGDFTLAGHFIVIYGYGKEGFQVNDPNCVARSRKAWTFEELGAQIKNAWAYGEW